MAKIGRNEPCPCGSGKKYKQCCLSKDEAALIAAAPKVETKAMRRQERDAERAAFQADAADYDDAMEMTELSNSVGDLIKAGKIDEAERVTRDLLERFPQVHDGFDRLAMVYEARGENQKAAEYYRKAYAFVRDHSDLYDPGFEDVFLEDADRLDPPPA
jgi:tetratricopeptide (TPR) repeat protein